MDMALILLGRSTCRICGKTLNEGEDVVAFPSGLFPDSGDKKWVLNDAGAHRACLLSQPWGEQAIQLLEGFLGPAGLCVGDVD
ncbi:hypothetical protein GCM10009838_21790 [Catenulispora subtropica]|uniref:Uncharacterized protein n=1 Tax=Catenulispora subtropica TaxID=450798 RepID=A0ABN2R6I1_9ACTN